MNVPVENGTPLLVPRNVLAVLPRLQAGQTTEHPLPLVCNCRRVVRRGDDAYAEFRVVKCRKWDCPSCGLDRKRTLATMCAVANAGRIITLTLEQPRVLFHGATEVGQLPDGYRSTLADGQLVPVWDGLQVAAGATPDRHRRWVDKYGQWQGCDPITHIAWNPRHGGYRWRVIPECPWCLRNLSRMLAAWVKRMRRAHPDFAYLQAREVHKSGAVHLHVAVTGLARVVTRRSRAGEHVKRAWKELGGGHVDVGRHGENAGRDAGWYVGKYLAKQQENRFARGYRRWSRAQAFAPSVRMTPPPRDPSDDGGWADPTAPLKLGGWLHPDGTEHRWRYTQAASERCEAARLDTRTANSPQDRRGGWSWRVLGVPDGLEWASGGYRRGTAGGDGVEALQSLDSLTAQACLSSGAAAGGVVVALHQDVPYGVHGAAVGVELVGVGEQGALDFGEQSA